MMRSPMLVTGLRFVVIIIIIIIIMYNTYNHGYNLKHSL